MVSVALLCWVMNADLLCLQHGECGFIVEAGKCTLFRMMASIYLLLRLANIVFCFLVW